MNNSPDITNASLLASNNRLPLLTAAKAEERPADPTIAAITISTCLEEAISSKAWDPVLNSVSHSACANCLENLSASDSSTNTATVGLNSSHCCNKSSVLP